MSLTLVIGNKNYSSWSLRPWLAMKQAGIAFNETNVLAATSGHDRKNSALFAERTRAVSDRRRTHCVRLAGNLRVRQREAQRERRRWQAFGRATRRRAREPARWSRRCIPVSQRCGRICRWIFGRGAPTKARLRFNASDVAADVARIQSVWNECLRKAGRCCSEVFRSPMRSTRRS